MLISGEVPVEGDKTLLPRLVDAAVSGGWDVDRFSASLRKLEALEPDIWLSAGPLFGRNANLYDRDWSRALLLNRSLVRKLEALRRQPVQ